MKRITLKFLERHKACEFQRDLFEATFGKSAEVNFSNITKAEKAGLSIMWLAWRIDKDATMRVQDRTYKKIWLNPKTGRRYPWSDKRGKLVDAENNKAFRRIILKWARAE